MHYALLGQTGLVVSRLAFGAMTCTAGNQDMGTVYKVGAELADTLVGRALERGVTFFDTADGYAGGESETLLGGALRRHRDDVVLGASKLSQLEDNLGAADLQLTHDDLAELDAATPLPPVSELVHRQHGRSARQPRTRRQPDPGTPGQESSRNVRSAATMISR